MKILVLDDDNNLRQRLCRAFERRGHTAVEAGSIAAAKQEIQNATPCCDACVVDLRLPGETGLEFVHWLRKTCPQCRVLVLTGFGSIATAVSTIRLGAADYLTKPADADQILAALLREETGSATVAGGLCQDFPSLDRVEWEHMQRVLQECGGNISLAARKLGIERRSLQRKLQKFPPQK